MSDKATPTKSTTLKRKVADDADVAPKTKKSKSSENATPSGPGPKFTNMTIPVVINLPEPTPGATKICSWNVAGLRACQKKGYKIYIEAEVPDILILTETKINEIPVDPTMDKLYPHRYWNIAIKKGYAGTAVFSKVKPLNVTYTLPNISTPDLVKGRLVILEFETYYLVATYVPNAGQKLKNMDAKIEWQRAFTAHLRDLDSKKPVVWGGDLNVAPTAKDLSNPKPNWNKTAGYTEIETAAFKEILNPKTATTRDDDEDASSTPPSKFVDAWRRMHPDEQRYSYYSFLRKCREKGIGWRLDMFIVSERLYESSVKTCEIRDEIYGGSDHVPIVMELTTSITP